MKQFLAVLLVISVCFGICGCDKQTVDPETTTAPKATSTPTATTVPPTTAAPTTEPAGETTAPPTTEAPTTAPTAEPTEAPATEPAEAPTTAPTEAPTTEPAEAPTTAPAAPSVLLCDTLYCLSDAKGEGSTKAEILEDKGIREDAWLVRFADGSGLMNLRGQTERVFFKDDLFWDPSRVYTYEIDGEGQFCFSRDYGDTVFCFAPTQEELPEVSLSQEQFPQSISDACDGVWASCVDSEGTWDERFPAGTAVTVELYFADTGECVPVFTIDLRADCSNDLVAARYEPGLEGMLIHGRLLDQPVLADSSLIIDEDCLMLWLRIGDPTAADTYTVQVRLERLDPGSAVG